MPELGEVKRAYQIGKKGWYKHIWTPCVTCGKQRWVQVRSGKPAFSKCRVCANRGTPQCWKGEQNPNWNGGRVHSNGYIYILLDPKDFFYPMAMTTLNGYVGEHRLVMARHLGRCLQSWEQVHHKDGNRGNNRIENLELCTRNTHISDHNKGYQDGYRKGLGDGRLQQIQELKQEIRLLRFEIRQPEKCESANLTEDS